MIVITWVTELVNNIPTLLNYIIYGYVFLSVYYWVSFTKIDSYKYFITKSIIVNYILYNFYNLTISHLIPIEYRKLPIRVLFLCIVSFILALVLGKVLHSIWFGNLLIKLRLGRTMNNNIWDDIIKSGMVLRIFMNDGTSYIGVYCKSEDYEREPLILLHKYQKWDENNEIVLDYFDNEDRYILLNTKDFKAIRIDYSQAK